jgi:hypothetical protein
VFCGYNSTKNDRPRLPLLVGPHAALCKPNQGPAQLRLSLDQAAPPRLRQLPDELSHTPVLYLLPVHTPLLPLPNRYGPKKHPLEVIGNFTRAASLDERMRLDFGNTEVAQNWDLWKGRN